MASKKTPAPRAKKTPAKAPASAPAASAADPKTTVAAVTQPATTKENPASTTKANDPALESTVPATNTATAMVNQDAGTGEGDKPKGEAEQARGEFHSHPAETAAERSLRLAGSTASPLEFPAGDDADPKADINQSPTEADLEDNGSRHDESGALQEATRQAIGAGYGAPDGIGGEAVPGADDSDDADDVEPVEVKEGLTFRGNKAKLWRMLEKGATHDEMRDETKYVSAIGTVYVMADQAGRTIDVTKAKDGTRSYKLAPAEK